MFAKRFAAQRQFVVLLAGFTSMSIALTIVPIVSADAATKSVTRCNTVKRKRICKQVRVRSKAAPVLSDATPASVVPNTEMAIASPPLDAGSVVVVTPVAVTPVAAPPLAAPAAVNPVVVTATPVAAPAPQPVAPPTQPATTTPTVSVVPVTAAPLPAATPKLSTPTNAGLGMVHRIGDAPIDDYPVALKNAPQDSTFDALRFPNRECTSFVALRVAADGRPLDSFFYQSTTTWAERAAQAGYGVDGNPRAGDIAHWVANEKQTFPDGSWSQAGPVGHVGYVTAVNADGTITLEDYNGAAVRGTYSVRSNTRAPRYIHYKN
jgi:surface antigen